MLLFNIVHCPESHFEGEGWVRNMTYEQTNKQSFRMVLCLGPKGLLLVSMASPELCPLSLHGWLRASGLRFLLEQSVLVHHDTNLLLTCNVIDYHGNCWVTYVAGNEATEPFLACCVPKLKSDLLVPAQGRNRKTQGRRRKRRRKENVL